MHYILNKNKRMGNKSDCELFLQGYRWHSKAGKLRTFRNNTYSYMTQSIINTVLLHTGKTQNCFVLRT